MTLTRTPSLRLNGKRAFVPGGSRGIVSDCAVALAEARTDVSALVTGTSVLVDGE